VLRSSTKKLVFFTVKASASLRQGIERKGPLEKERLEEYSIEGGRSYHFLRDRKHLLVEYENEREK